MRRAILIIASTFAFASYAGHAAPHLPTSAAIATDSTVYIERPVPNAGRRLEPATRLSPGDRVITIVRWQRTGASGGFVVTNALPRSLSYQQSSSERQEVSVDGGKTWGFLEDLRIGGRDAVPEDVTDIRWRIPAGQAPRTMGQLAYAGIVR